MKQIRSWVWAMALVLALLWATAVVPATAAQPASLKTVSLSQVVLSKDSYSGWCFTFQNASDYVQGITGVQVNGVSWTKTYYLSSGGQYKLSGDSLQLAEVSYNVSAPAVKSGDVITISSAGYADLTFQLVIDPSGTGSVTEVGSGDPYTLHVKLVGSFEAAIVGQEEYDGISSASTGGASSSQNSSVTVYGALVEGDAIPGEEDWEELNHLSKIQLEGSKCSVSIVPDPDTDTPSNSDSGMEGVYLTLSSDLTLHGTPKDPGCYRISISIEDKQGRKATSNALPFRIYTGQETLAEQLQEKNFTQYETGLYAWDIMEPWAISQFGSNVAGAEESVRVPAQLEAWFGSHQSGTYGYLGYDIPWADVLADQIPQTLYIPDGCDLTMTNLHILSSVRIVVEQGGKLTLLDSCVQGVIEVRDGGTFSMNYDSFRQCFTTGASLCGQLRLADGATLENAAIYSHTNYLANGDLTDRSNHAAVVAATGQVQVRGQVFLHGDEAGSTGIGQTALSVTNGVLSLDDDAVLVAYGGGGNTTIFSDGGYAIALDHGEITGGKLVAIGGSVTFGNGGHGVTGSGTLSTQEVFLQGATAYTAKNVLPGQALNGSIDVSSPQRHIADGQLLETASSDPLEALAWKTGIAPTPPTEQFLTQLVQLHFTMDSIPSRRYSGLPVKPQVRITENDTLLTEGVHYVLSYADAQGHTLSGAPTQIGVYTVTATGKGLYGGVSTQGTFRILPAAAGSVTVQAPAAPAFSDLSVDDYYADAVQWAVTNGITTGIDEDHFGGNLSCTRAQIVTFLWRAAGTPEPASMGSFQDVPADAYYAKAAAWAVAQGITTGSDAGHFSPHDFCTREQAVTFLYRAHGSRIGSSIFLDVPTDAFYTEAVAWATVSGVTTGLSSSLFGVGKPCTRAQIITFLYRINQK